MSASAGLLGVDQLSVAYSGDSGSVRVLEDVSIHVDVAEIVGIVGESGCGKSTLSAALLGLMPPNGDVTHGRVMLAGRDLVQLQAEEMRRVRGREAAMIFQDPMTSLNPTFTVGAQMIEAQRSHTRRRGASKRELLRRAVAALEEVGIPDADRRIHDYPHQFSGGQRQRIMIALALMLHPSLLIADEPTSALDATLEAQILELLYRLREDHGTAILLISHDLGVVAQVCDRVIVMYAGRVVEHGRASDLFSQPRHPYTQALLAAIPSASQRGGQLRPIPGRVPSFSSPPAGCRFADRCLLAHPVCEAKEPDLYEGVRCYVYDPVMGQEWRSLREPTANTWRNAGGEMDAAARPRAGKVVDVVDQTRERGLVIVDDLRTHFAIRGSAGRLISREKPVIRAVDGVDLTIHRGEIVGLVGESGSGKTTLGETILRLTPATSGSVSFDGTPVEGMQRDELRAMRRRAQLIFQEPHASLSPRQRVGAIITEPYAINDPSSNERLSAIELLEMVGLPAELRDRYPNHLSGGQARRVGIARALATKPEFVVADEPTSGLDVSAAAATLNLMQDLRQTLGLTYLIITHNINLLGYIADRIAVMYLGKLVETGSAEDVMTAPLHPYTRGLMSLALGVEGAGTRRRLLVPGEIPSPSNVPSGCSFHPRCPFAQPRCKEETPPPYSAPGARTVACHYWREIEDASLPNRFATEALSAGTREAS